MVATLDPISDRVAKIKPENFEGDLIKPGHPFYGYIWVNKERMSGSPCFTGSRVPIRHLFDSLKAGETIDEFLVSYRGILYQQCTGVLEMAASGLLCEFEES